MRQALLREHRWPGNVRELRNALQRAVLLAREPELRPEDLAPALHAGGAGGAEGRDEAPAGPGGAAFREAKRRVVEDFNEAMSRRPWRPPAATSGRRPGVRRDRV